VPRRKTELEIASLAQSRLAPETFFDALTPSLELHILPSMGKVSETKLESFGVRLYTVALHISQILQDLDLARDAEQPIRSGRLRCSRARAAIGHSLKYLRKAESISKTMIDRDGLTPAWLNFQPAQQALERLKKRIGDLESTNAALIHPSLRKRGKEESLARETPYNLHHPEFKVTPGSQEVMHRAVEMLDDEIQEFTRGKVKAGHVNNFIKEFLEFAFDWTVDVANVKTIRHRYHESKLPAPTSSILATRIGRIVSNNLLDSKQGTLYCSFPTLPRLPKTSN
jgi:hypothetical protein